VAEEEKNDQVEETPADEAADQTPAEETPAEDAATEEAPAAGGDAAAADAEPAEVLTPKERRKVRRATRKRRPRPQMTPEERHAARVAERKIKAQSRRKQREKLKEQKRQRGPREGTPPAAHEAGAKRVRQGVVVSDKADKTITVRIDTARRHRKYQKIVRSSSTLHAHDEANDAHIGDRVKVIESRPLSATKRWRLTEVLERAK
jgi:small subunit ribosomal protein S17